MHSSDSYVATSIIMSQHSFSAAATSLCRDPSFMLRQDSVQVMLQHSLVLSVFLSRPRMSVTIEACCH